MDKVFKSGSAVYFDLEGNAVFKSFLKFINDAEKSEAIRKRIFSNIFSWGFKWINIKKVISIIGPMKTVPI